MRTTSSTDAKRGRLSASHEYPGEPVAARQTTPVDSLQRNIACWSPHDYSQIVVTPEQLRARYLAMHQFNSLVSSFKKHQIVRAVYQPTLCTIRGRILQPVSLS